MLRERIQEWLAVQARPKSIKDIQKRFLCSQSAARLAAMDAVKQDRVAFCVLGREYHFSKKEKQ